MSLMSSLYIGASGLQTSQNALNTTAHNLSNEGTTGYTRQQVQQAARQYVTLSVNPHSVSNQQTGLGTSYSHVKQVRDYFLDRTFRKESGRSMFYQVSTETMEEVESLLGEMNREAFQTNMSDFWTSVQELVKTPSSSVCQGLFVQRAGEFLERSVHIYDSLCAYQDNMNQKIKQHVDKINNYGKQIMALNDQIRAIEVGGIEHANDLRDVRNQILDELGELADISFSENIYGDVSVKIEGVDFVQSDICFEIALHTDEVTGFYTPFWPLNARFTERVDGTRDYDIRGAEVFDLTQVISTDMNTDIGGVKAMMWARGDHRADHTDIDTDYDSISQSIIMNMQAEFDQMIHNIAGTLNGILAQAAGVEEMDITLATPLEDGTTVLRGVKACKDEPGGYMRHEDGSPIQLFSKITTPAYQKVEGIDENGDAVTYWVYQEEDPARPETVYSLKNIQVDQELQQSPSMLGFMKGDYEDRATAEALSNAFMEDIYTLNPNVKKTTSFLGYYDDLVAQVANSGYAFRCVYVNQQNTVEATFNAREQIVGVSSDEELSNMIRFQNAYNASSRYINAISEMLEHIINTLGV
ncbi:MAG: flagellar hook-associated protein FlgK [Acetatifactor sp.]|nr:flagellar hook-associated protein FlgK [Acetatifactor sp.]